MVVIWRNSGLIGLKDVDIEKFTLSLKLNQIIAFMCRFMVNLII